MESKNKTKTTTLTFEFGGKSVTSMSKEEIEKLKTPFIREVNNMNFAEMVDFLYPYRKNKKIGVNEFTGCVVIIPIKTIIDLVTHIKAVIHYNKSKETK